MANNPQISGVQYRPAVPAQQFIPVTTQPFQPIGRGVPPMNALPPAPPQFQQPFYSQPTQQFPPRAQDMLPLQTIPLPVALPNNHPLPIAHPQPSVQTPSNFTPGIGGPGVSFSSSYTFAPSYGQIRRSFNDPTSVIAQQQTIENPAMTNSVAPVTSVQPDLSAEALSDWIEHMSSNGKKYYYNRRTRLSSWEKPVELMTPTEKADATTNWKEFTSPDGKKYYYNKVTKESKWVMPEELKLAREQVAKASHKETQQETSCSVPDSVSSPTVNADASPKALGITSSPVSVEPVAAVVEPQGIEVSRSSSSPHVASAIKVNTVEDPTPSNVVSTSDTDTGSIGTATNVATEKMNNSNNAAQDTINSSDGVSTHHKEEASNGLIGEKANDIAPEDIVVDREPLVYANKLDAKNAFMTLMESANIGSDWTWDRAMRVIINDKRYGALKTLGERKHAFNEFLGQRKKQEAEERRIRQKKAREEFKRMLEESAELTSSIRWSKAESLFEKDERFRAVERDRDRKDLFDNYIEELKKKERAKEQEERKRKIIEYRQFLESCDFIKASSQWRKVQDRLEADERCYCLEKIDRLEHFQEYLNDLEREEEEQRKIQKEELRKAERKNRDEFRKLMEDHVAAGTLTAKTHWRDYCVKVKELPEYQAVASNTSGSTSKDLFEDVVEELQKQYHDDKSRVKDAVKLGKITLSSTWTLDDFKNAITNDIGSPPVRDVNLKLVFDELLERVREKEEKEAKKRKRLVDDFSYLLSSIKEINASSEWEDCKSLFDKSHEYSSIGLESLCQQIFEKYVMQLKEQAKEREQKRKEEKARQEKEREEGDRSKVKQRKEKEGGRMKEKEEHLEKEDGMDNKTADLNESRASKDEKRSVKESNRRHRKRHHSSEDYADENETDQFKKSHGPSSEHKKSRRHEESDHESRHKRHRRGHRQGSRRHGDHEELEDGEFGDGKVDSQSFPS
ncbi:Pre-mRNA-processing factor 40-A-like protein [Morus notabilis]|uniref:Pre-mRNA-processing factor 40-A-like protein n=1 Tax=Morus notabilis TaxID=981085 RepID=W9R006_9ROSA|nr:Pre-mRNA-processing factor 40-A-like protein [Morus notabilis]